MDFDYDRAWTLEGTLETQHADAIATFLRARFGVDPADGEREWRVTASDRSVTIWLRQDDPPGPLADDLLQVAPDAQGTLILTYPYEEWQAARFPEHWVFDGRGFVAIYDTVLVREDSPRLVVELTTGSTTACVEHSERVI